jgi:hypothetical protein
MTKGEVDDATRRAFNILQGWNDVSGVFSEGTGYWAEIQGVIEDAVHCGIQAALEEHRILESEAIHAQNLLTDYENQKSSLEVDA